MRVCPPHSNQGLGRLAEFGALRFWANKVTPAADGITRAPGAVLSGCRFRGPLPARSHYLYPRDNHQPELEMGMAGADELGMAWYWCAHGTSRGSNQGDDR